MSGESLWVAFAYAHGYCNGDAYCYRGTKVHSFTASASYTAASTLRPAF